MWIVKAITSNPTFQHFHSHCYVLPSTTHVSHCSLSNLRKCSFANNLDDSYLLPTDFPSFFLRDEVAYSLQLLVLRKSLAHSPASNFGVVYCL